MLRDFEGKLPQIDPSAYIDEAALIIGDVAVGPDSSVWPHCTVRGDVNRIRIGARTNIQDNSVLHVTHDSHYRPGGYPLELGDEITVGHGVILHGCRIEDRCLIGMGAIVMDGAVLRSQVLLGAGSLVPPRKTLDGGYLWVGRPAKRVRPLTEEELGAFEYSAGHYVRLKNRHHKP